MKEQVDFGVYHHSSREESEKIRSEISSMFYAAIENIENVVHTEKPARALDAGCGLGFISYLIFSKIPGVHIYSVDNFTDPSLKDNSVERTLKNFEYLGMTEKVSVVKSDVKKLPFDDGFFSIAASSLVYHNLGRYFFNGISEIQRVLNKDGIFLYGDIFVEKRMEQIEELFRIVDLKKSSSMKEYSLLTLSGK